MDDVTEKAGGWPERIRELATGDLRRWPGLTRDCTRRDVEAALGQGLTGEDEAGFLDGSPTAFRGYPALGATRGEVVVWYVDDVAVLLRVPDYEPIVPLTEQLGMPEATAPSLLRAFHTQWVYAGRGLTAHVEDDTGAVSWLFGYPPTTPEEYLDSWLSRLEMRRIPRR
jgi:hypothetical protein